MLERAARFHAEAAPLAAAVRDWDHDAELRQCGARLAALAEEARAAGLPQPRHLRRSLQRLVAGLPELRRGLLGFEALPATVIHGDLHSGNVLLRRTSRGEQPAFLDWDRARRGSPLEDVSSWLQSLAYWEPAVRRRHDTLLGVYLAARGLPPARASARRQKGRPPTGPACCGAPRPAAPPERASLRLGPRGS